MMAWLLAFELLILIWCMQLVNGHSNDIKVCVSYEDDYTFLNVEWDWKMVNSKGYGIKVVYHNATEDDMRFSTVLFPYNNVTNTKIWLKDIVHLGDTLVVVVSIITKDHNIVGSSSIFQTVAKHLHKVVYSRIDEHSIEFTCIMACMSPVIEGCAITLRNKNIKYEMINNNTKVKGSNSFKLYQVSVQLNGLKPFEHYNYLAVPLMKNKRYTTETKGTVFALGKADESSSGSYHDGQDSNTSVILTITVSVGILIVLTTGGVMVLLWCCYKAVKNSKEDAGATKKIEQDTVIHFTANDVASSESFTAEHQQSNQPLLNSVPNSEFDSSSIMTSSSNGTVTDDCNQHESIADNSEEEKDSPKPNRKMGVAIAVIESEDLTEDDSKPLQETAVKRKRWYRLIKPKTRSSHCNIHNSPISSKGKLEHSGSTNSLKIRFNRFLGRSYSSTLNHQVYVKSGSVNSTKSNKKKAHHFSASNIW